MSPKLKASKSLITSISIPENNQKLSVKKEISISSLNQLFEYTKTDPQIKSLTHDKERFKNIESFNKWFGTGKHFYTLTDEENKLLGVVWLHKKASTFQKYPFTFAIRTYSYVRGKGLAKEFAEACLEDFSQSEEFLSAQFKGIWIEINKKNIISYNFNKKLGFKEVKGVNSTESIFMLLDL